jgi:hypothetical protein
MRILSPDRRFRAPLASAWSRAASVGVIFWAILFAQSAWAHPEEDDALPATPGMRLGLTAALRAHAGSARLPSQGLPGYLLLGDSGQDARGGQLEHGVFQAGYRYSEAWGAHLGVGAHGKDPLHVEAAWLRWQGETPSVTWQLIAGRQAPVLGPVLGPAGHLDHFGSMPLAKHAVLNGDWLEDGMQWRLAGHHEAVNWRVDLGVWGGRHFPGSLSGGLAPSLHLGVAGEGSAGAWALDAFFAQFHPQGRGAQVYNTSGAHTHAPLDCRGSIVQLVCFDGRSRLGGLSAQWQPYSGPWRVSAAVLGRQDSGTLYSSNGSGAYLGKPLGQWLEARWQDRGPWSIAWRHERLRATQTLTGIGVVALSNEAGMSAYRSLRRDAVAIGFDRADTGTWYAEAGQEHTTTLRGRFVALRWLWSWTL